MFVWFSSFSGGRLNLLVSSLNYPARSLFAKVKGQSILPESMNNPLDDVASHIGTSVTKKFDLKNPINVTLLNNSSHLEAVNPISQGKTKAKQDYKQRKQNKTPER